MAPFSFVIHTQDSKGRDYLHVLLHNLILILEVIIDINVSPPFGLLFVFQHFLFLYWICIYFIKKLNNEKELLQSTLVIARRMFSFVPLPFSHGKQGGKKRKRWKKLDSATTYAFLPVGDSQIMIKIIIYVCCPQFWISLLTLWKFYRSSGNLLSFLTCTKVYAAMHRSYVYEFFCWCIDRMLQQYLSKPHNYTMCCEHDWH